MNRGGSGASRGNAAQPGIFPDTFEAWSKFSQFLFPYRPLQVSLFSRSASIHVVQSVIQPRTTGQLKRLRRRCPWRSGSFMSTGSRPSLSPGKFDGSRRRQSVEPRRPLQGVASLEPRICCSRGDTERQVGAGSCCLLQRKSQAGKVIGSRVLQAMRWGDGGDIRGCGRAVFAAPPRDVAHN